MARAKRVEEVVEETPVVEVETAVEDALEGEEKHEGKKPTSASLKDALKQVETFGQALSDALQARGNVVMVRVNDEALTHMDMLVDAEVTKSRSESAAFLIAEGIKANQALFEKIGSITRQISELREQLRKDVKLEPEA